MVKEKIRSSGKSDGEYRINYALATDYEKLSEYIAYLEYRYPAMRASYIGATALGRRIPLITLGENPKSRGVFYLGGLDGCESVTVPTLLRFVSDYLSYLEEGKRMWGISVPFLYESRTLHILPMLNPDGYHIRKNGIDGLPSEERLRPLLSDGCGDMKYNGVGKHLASSFVSASNGECAPESVPEISAVCSYIRMAESGIAGPIDLAVSLNAHSDVVRGGVGCSMTPREKTVMRLFSRMTGCEIDKSGKGDGSFADWFVSYTNKPAIDCGCLSDGEGNSSDSGDYIKVYAALREALFSSALLI